MTATYYWNHILIGYLRNICKQPETSSFMKKFSWCKCKFHLLLRKSGSCLKYLASQNSYSNVLLITLVSQLLLFCSIHGCFCSSFLIATAIVAIVVVMYCASTINQKVLCAFHQIAHSLEPKYVPVFYRVQDCIINLCCLLV